MEQTGTEKVIIKQCMAERLPLPGKIQNAPKVLLGLELYYTAFWDLTTCRSTGLSVAPIPWSAMKEYCEVYELDASQSEALFFLVRQMDNVYMDYRARKGGQENG